MDKHIEIILQQRDALRKELEREALAVLDHYKEIKRQRGDDLRGINVRIRQMIERYGIQQAMARIIKLGVNPGLIYLCKLGMQEHTWEMLVQNPKYHTLFSDVTRAQALINLVNATAAAAAS